MPVAILLLQASQSIQSPLRQISRDIVNLITTTLANLKFNEEWEDLIHPDNYTQFNAILEIKRLEKALKSESDSQIQTQKKNKIEEIRKEINSQYDWM